MAAMKSLGSEHGAHSVMMFNTDLWRSSRKLRSGSEGPWDCN